MEEILTTWDNKEFCLYEILDTFETVLNLDNAQLQSLDTSKNYTKLYDFVNDMRLCIRRIRDDLHEYVNDSETVQIEQK